MSDLFDTLVDDPKKKKKDLFDEVAAAPAGDVFDQVAPTTGQDIFDQVETKPAEDETNDVPRGTNGQKIYPETSVTAEVLKGLPGMVGKMMLPTEENLKDFGAAAAYEGAGAVKGATLGYVDPTKALDKTPLADANISKTAAEGTGQFVGAMAPISKISQAVHAGLAATGILESVHPILQGLVQSGIVGSIYGAARDPGQPAAKEGQLAARAHNALDDAASFIVLTGAGQLVDQAAQALSLGKNNAYNSLREDIINKFTSKGATPEEAAQMADAGLNTAVKNGGGWADLKASDLRAARRAVRAGQKIIIGEAGEQSPGMDGGPSQPQPTPPALNGPAGVVPVASDVGGLKPEAPAESSPPSTVVDEHSVSVPGIQYLKNKFPALAQEIVGKPVPLPPEQLQDVLKQAAAAGEAVLLKGGNLADANTAAVKHFQAVATPLIQANAAKPQPVAETPSSAKPDVFDEAEAALAQTQPVHSAPGLADVTRSLGIEPHEMPLDQYGQAFGESRPQSEVTAEHRGLVNQALQSGKSVPAEVLADHPSVQSDANKELARQAAQEVLSKNKIEDRTAINLVNHIVADNTAFKAGRGRDFDPEKDIIRGETKTPLDRGSADRLQSVINLADGAGPRTGRHEAFHAVSNMLLDDGERAIIENQFKGSMEDAADAFADHRTGKRTVNKGPLRTIFDKIKKFLDRLKNYFKKRKFATAEDIFDSIDRGDLAERGSRPTSGNTDYGITSMFRKPKAAASTTSPEFKKWFGESKVVDKSGEPLVAYHGTDAKFSSFDPARRELGFHFGASPELSDSRIDMRDPMDQVPGTRPEYKHGGAIMPVYLRIQNPIHASHDAGEWNDVENVKDAIGWEDRTDIKTIDELRNTLKAEGYDGIEYKNQYENYPGMKDADRKSYIAFEPDQIKSKFNSGSFNEDADIRYSSNEKPGAKFIGWQQGMAADASGPEIPDSAMFNITGNHPNAGSTVYAESLKQSGIAVPEHPSLEEWKKNPKVQYSAENLPAERKPAQTFYSQLENTIVKKMQAKSSPEQLKAMLKNSQEIRKDEIEWSGIGDWLDKQTGTITKDQVMAYLKANSLELKEQVRGGGGLDPKDIVVSKEFPPIQKDARTLTPFTAIFKGQMTKNFFLTKPDADGNMIIEDAREAGLAEVKDKSEIPTALAEWFTKYGGTPTKWEQYTLAGPDGRAYGQDKNSNYREFVTSIPNAGYAEKDRYLRFVEDLAENRSDKKIVPVGGNADPFSSFDSLESWVRNNYGDVNLMLEKITPEQKRTFIKLRDQAREADFKGSHWNDPNVMLHVRTTDRATPDGKKILFIEEVQSDWHEHGRAEGYQEPVAKVPPKDTFKVEQDEHQYIVTAPGMDTLKVGKGVVAGEPEARDYAEGHWMNRATDREKDNLTKIPDAPFKNTWHELGMKMALRRAVEEGYDSIAWTTADMQKKRWADKPIFDYLYGKAIPSFMEKYVKKLGSGLSEIDLTGVGKKQTNKTSTYLPDYSDAPWQVFDPSGSVVDGAEDEDEAADLMQQAAEENWSVQHTEEYYVNGPNGQDGDYHESESDAEDQMRELAMADSPLRVKQDGEEWVVEEPDAPHFEVRDQEGFARYTTDTNTEAVKRMRELEAKGVAGLEVKQIDRWQEVERFGDEDAANEYVEEKALQDWSIQTNEYWTAYNGDTGSSSDPFDYEQSAQDYISEHATDDWSVAENEDWQENQPIETKPGKPESTVQVPGVEITPQMRESILYTGQPLYSAEDVKRDIDRTLIPSRKKEPKAYTEKMALRRSLQRQVTAAAQGAAQQADRILGVQTVVGDALLKLIPEADRGPYLEQLIDIQTLDDADKFISKIERDSKRLSAAADKSLLKEEIAKRKQAMAADKEERSNLRRLLMREAAVARQAAVATNRDITQIKRSIVDNIEAQLPIEERGRFLKMVASSSNWKDVIKAVGRIDQAVDDFARKEIIGSLKREVQRVQASKAIAVDYRWRVNDLMQSVLFKKPSAFTLSKLKALQDYIDQQRKLNRDVTVPQYVADRLKILSAMPIDSIHTTILEDILGQVRQLAELGKTKLRTIREIDAYNKENDLKDLTASTVPILSKQIKRPFPGEELSNKEAASNILRKGINIAQRVKYSIMPPDVLFDLLDGMQSYAGPNYRIFKARTDGAFQNYLADSAKIKQAAADKAKGLDRKNFERIGAYAIGVQDEGLEKLNNLGYTPEKIKAIKLTPAELSFYKWMREQLDAARPRIAETMRTVYNADLGEVKNYFPFMTDLEYADEADIDRRMSEQVMGYKKKNPEMGFTKERVGVGDQKVNIDALDVFSRHMDDVAYLNNVGPTTKYMGELANTDAYKKLAGDYGTRMVRDWIDTIARKGGVIGGQQIAVLDKLRSNVGAATLAFKLSSTLVQTTPLIEGAALIGNYAFRGGAKFTMSPKWRHFVLDNMPEIKERSGDDPAMSEFVKGGKIRAALEKSKELGFWSLKKLDEWAAAGVAAGAYQKFMDGKKLPIDFTKPNKEALAYAQLIVRRTQASPFFKDVPMAITRGMLTGNRSFDRALFQFQNFVLNQYSLLAYEGARAGIFNGKPGTSLSVWTYTILAIIATAGMRIGLDELKAEFLHEKHRKKEDLAEKLISQSVQELVSRIPFVSQAMSLVTWGSMPLPAFEAVRRFGEGASGVYGYYNKDNKRLHNQKKPFKKAIVKTATAAGQIAGVPGSVEVGDVVRRNMK